MIYDVAIIGAGVAGSLIARELSRYELSICLIDKEADVAMGSTKANSAIIHAGFDAKPGSLKAKLNIQGNAMMDKVAKELSVPFMRNGSIVLAFDAEEMEEVRALYNRGIENGVPELKVLTSLEQVKALEPNISEKVLGALYAPTGGIICPYELTIAAAENAVANGAEIRLECEIKDIKIEDDCFRLITSKEDIKSRFVVNAAGLYSDVVSKMVGEDLFAIKPRKGEYLLLDKSQGRQVNTTVFQTPTKMGKGILVTPTVDGNLLIGPNATDIENKEDVSTTPEGLNQVIIGALKSVPGINVREVVTSFAGLRATPTTGDFIIEASRSAKGFINVSGIESPGLTASPAIAEYVTEILKIEGLNMTGKKDFNPFRKPLHRFREMSEEEKIKVIMDDPRYGRIICRCETVTEGEIVECINRPAGARNIDAVKRRSRSGMGRCQGGFCTPRIVEILSRELGISMKEVTKKGGDSRMLVGEIK